jgi:hypothetical protein
MTPPEESDQLPEEGPGDYTPDDTGSGSQGKGKDGGEDSAGTPGEEGQGSDEQATGNPKNAG